MTGHSTVKQILLELGEESEKYIAKSGDSEPLDIRLGKRHITYQPDVYWINRKGEIVIFEIPYTEQPREIVGEVCLASLVRNVVKFIAIFNNEDWAKEVKAFITIPDEQIRDEKGEYRTKYKAKVICIPENLGDNEGRISRFLRKQLKDEGWL